MASSSPFTDPDLRSSVSRAREYFPNLQADEAEWLYSLLPAADQAYDDEVPASLDARLMAFDTVLQELAASIGINSFFPVLRFLVVFEFLPGLADLFSPRALGRERISFDWKAFFREKACLDLLCGLENQTNLMLLLTKTSAAKTAWLDLPDNLRGDLYGRGFLSSYPEILLELESLPSGLDITPDTWPYLALGSARFVALHRCRQGTLSHADLSSIPEYSEVSHDHDLFIKNAISIDVYARIYGAVSLETFIVDSDRILRPDEIKTIPKKINGEKDPKFEDELECVFADQANRVTELLPSEEVRRCCGTYLLERILRASPDDLVASLLHILGEGNSGYIPYMGSRDPEYMKSVAIALFSRIVEPEVLPRFRESIAASGSCWIHDRDPFQQTLLDEIDCGIAADPAAEKAFLYSLWYLLPRATSIEFMHGVKQLRSIVPMLRVCLEHRNSIAPMIEPEDIGAFDLNARIEWRSVLATAADALLLSCDEYVNAMKEPGNLCILKIAQGEAIESFPFALFSKPFRLVCDFPSDPEFFELIAQRGIALEDRKSALLVCAALSCRKNHAMDSVKKAIFAGRSLPVTVVLTYILSCFGDGEMIDDERLIQGLRELHILRRLNPDDLQRLVEKPTTLLDAILADSEVLIGSSPYEDVTKIWFECWRLIGEGIPGGPGRLHPESFFILRRRILEILKDPNKGVTSYQRNWALELSACVFDVKDEAVFADTEFGSACSQAARDSLDFVRKAARSNDNSDDLKSILNSAYSISSILHNEAGWWKPLKQLLLAFRFIDRPAVDGSLDPFCGPEDNLWAVLPRAIHRILDRAWDSEEGRELKLEMAHDLLEKLKPVKKTSAIRTTEGQKNRDLGRIDEKKEGYAPDLSEPDPDWRYAYVRAIADLGVDPGGTGHFNHQVLEKVAMCDPSPRVREAATKAASSLRTRTGYKSGSIKRHVLNAWWWIRQAQVICSGGTVDPDAALRRRDAEVRR